MTSRWRLWAGAGGAAALVAAVLGATVLGSFPARPAAALLWFEGRAATPVPDGAVVLDGAGDALLVSRHLLTHRLSWWLGGREPTSVARDARGRYWVATRDAAVVVLDANGLVVDSVTTPYSYPWVVGTPGGDIWVHQSPQQFSFPFGKPVPPLVTGLAGAAPPAVPGRRPALPLMADLVNAGRVVPAGDGGFYYAPFIRDEVVRYGPDGDTLWVTRRGLPHGVEEPSIGLDTAGRPELDYAPVNLGLAWGPDSALYVLSTPGHTVARSRLDRLDPATGAVLHTMEIPEALPTVAVTAGGAIEVLSPLTLLTGVAPAEREPFPSFALATPIGDSLRSDAFRGKVLLVNFWASWCLPCREEMPALDSLWQEQPADRFAFVAVSEDVVEQNARAFIADFGFAFPVAFGHGRLRERYRYFGLPHTVLVDADGRVVYQWSGYGGPDQMASLRAMIAAELEREDSGAGSDATPMHEHHHH